MIKIKIEKQTRQVYLNNGYIGNDNENLQDTLEFSFKDEFVDGQARLELKFEDNTKTFITLEKENETYTIPITNIMTVKGQVYAQLVVTEGTNIEEVPIFKSNVFYFYVNESINAETGAPEPYIEWIDKADAKLNEVEEALDTIDGKLDDIDTAINEANSLDLDVSKSGKETTVEITKKDNTKKVVQILDGKNLEFQWDGTYLGIREEGDTEYQFVNLQGQIGPIGPQGNPFQVKKTYATIQLMIADYDNMEINDYVMISGNIEQEDNAKLFVKTEQEDPVYRWQYLADFSGASGVVGPQGASVTSATINTNGELVLTVE